MSDDQTYKVARLGVEVEAWFRTPVGQHVLERAQAEVDELFEMFMDATTPVEIMHDTRDKANAARAAIIWLNDAIAEGQAAANALEQEREHVG